MTNLNRRGKGECQSSLVMSPEERENVREVQDEYFSGPTIIVDDRELVSKVAECLSSAGAHIKLERLITGDYKIGERILVERKTSRDFVDTLIERDLLGQIRTMSVSCLKPVVIIEGENLYGQRDIHPNAIRGALAAIGVNFGVTIFMTDSPQDTAELLMVLARREDDESSDERGSAQKRMYHGNSEALEAIVAAFPDIGLKHARSLLESFGSIFSIVNAEKEDLLKVAGIGVKKAERIYELSRLSYP
jgi:Fanconi anemia group M protein